MRGIFGNASNSVAKKSGGGGVGLVVVGGGVVVVVVGGGCGWWRWKHGPEHMQPFVLKTLLVLLVLSHGAGGVSRRPDA